MTPASTEPVFLSYSHADRQTALVLRTALENAGIGVFHDDHSIRTGDNWMQRLQDALQHCSAFVLLVGRDGVRRWVGAEVQVALTRHLSTHDDAERLPIFPLLLPDADENNLPPFLALFQHLPWHSGTSLPDGLIEAIRAKTELLNTASTFDGCPFQGLSAFQPEQARLFFGRRKETLEALDFLGSQVPSQPEQIQRSGEQFRRWLQIEGNSGAGKSSLVNAGLLPLIEQGALWARTGFSQWQILGPMLPGEMPLQRLAEVLEQGLVANPEQRNSLQRLTRLEQDPRALACMLNDRKDGDKAYLLVVDQFEELFTFSNPVEQRHFDAQLAYALQDKDCPLFLISTVRIDFLEGFERLPKLSECYNSRCKRYLLKTITQDGLREAIEQPARLAGLDVSEITTAMLRDAEGEAGALPLVENALHCLWEQRRNNRLSGSVYHAKGGMAGLLEMQADDLLQCLDAAVSKGKAGALELLLAMTRINDEGRHSRRRIPQDEALRVAGNDDLQRGQKILDYLSGRPEPDGRNRKTHGSLRLIVGVDETAGRQANGHALHYDLIHETLIRSRLDDNTGKRVGYWQTLYDYIDKNRHRSLHRQQLQQQAEAWASSKGLGRWWHLAGLRDLRLYQPLRVGRDSGEARFLYWSRAVAGAQALLLVLLLGVVGESFYWRGKNDLPLDAMLMQQRFRLIDAGWLAAPLPEMVNIPAGTVRMGEQDKAFMKTMDKKLYPNLGYPNTTAEITQPFYLGKYEVTYQQYDYYVWEQQRRGKAEVKYPTTAKGGRGQRPVANVTWHEANAYLRWLSAVTGQTYRLPTEAEWEHAARAGTSSAYWWGEQIGQNHADCDGCGSPWDNNQSAPVGSFAANRLGLHDTAGNVWEWTCSRWREQFDGSEQTCGGEMGVELWVLRGGSWDIQTVFLRSSIRYVYFPGNRYDSVGFRAARTN